MKIIVDGVYRKGAVVCVVEAVWGEDDATYSEFRNGRLSARGASFNGSFREWLKGATHDPAERHVPVPGDVRILNVQRRNIS